MPDLLAYGQWYANLLVVMPRAMVATLLIPVFAPGLVPGPIVTSSALAMASVALIGATGVESLDQLAAPAVTALLIKEAAVGLLIGLSFGMIFWIARAIGEIIDYQVALTFSKAVDPVNGQQVSTTASFMEKVSLVYIVAAGGLLVFADTLLLSYELWPVGSMAPDLFARAGPLLIDESSRLLSFALLLAGPAMLVVFMIDMGFGLLGKAAPQLNLMAIVLPIKLPAALFVLFLAMAFVLNNLMDAFLTVRRALLGLLGG